MILVVLAALLLDRIFSEPDPHPLCWIGGAADRLELALNDGRSIAAGIMATLITVMPVTAMVRWLEQLLSGSFALSIGFDVVVLWFVIGWQSMRDHALAVVGPLQEQNLELARTRVAMIVSRDTADMDTQQVTTATVESVLENAHDCLFASLFWFAVAGPAGAIAHRLVNTLDAMWGYRTARFDRFGRFPARLDDLLGYIPAHLTAMSYTLVGRTGQAFRCWRSQANTHPSPNAGVVMTTGAGALGLQLGGTASYNGTLRHKPALGSGPIAIAEDVCRAIRLVNAAILIWLLVFALWSAFALYMAS